MKKLLYLIPILALLQASSFAQNPDSLKKVCEYDTFPVGAIRYLPGDTIVKMFGMNFTWYAWGYAGTPLGHPQQASIREFSGIATRDPFYKDTNATITTADHNSIFWTAAYGKDIRVYLPGTSGITSEYTFGWNTKSGNLISPSDPEWRIDTTGLHSGDYVLRDLGSALSDPYNASAANHRRSFSYDFVYFFKPTELSGISSGTTALYSLEYWVKKSTDTGFVFYLADTITKNSYNALGFANTQVGGRNVGAENLATWDNQTSNFYKLQKHILRIDTFYVGDTAPQVDVRLRNFQQIPIYVRCLRIRDWVAQRLLSAKADSLMNLVIDVVKSHDGNDSIKSWSVGNEPFPPTFHCFAYLNDLFVKRSAPPLNVLAPTNPPWDYSLFTRVERDQSENITGKAKMFLWDEELISQGPQWRSWSVDTTYHPQKASWYWDEGDFPARPLPINFTSDSAEWYHRGVYTESNYTKFTNQWQNNIIGFPSEAVEGGRGMMRDKLNIAKSCYELDPLHPVPYWGCYQAGASQYFIPIWSVDSEKIALNKSTAWADSVYEARIVNPYVNRHPGEILVVDSLYHLFYKWRASSEAEMRFQLWAGIHAGLKGYILNMAFDDMGNNDGILWDTGGVIVKSYDRTEMRFDNSSDGSHKLISPYTGRYFRNGSTYKQKSTLLPGFKGMFNAVRNTITNELGPIATTLGKLSWKGLLSWHKRDSIPTYLQRLPVKNVTAKSLSGMTDADSATYVNFGIHKLSTDTTALYVSIQNRRLWSDPLDTLTTDYRTIAFQVDSTKFPEGDQKFRLFSISDVAGKLRDTIISTRDTFLFTVKPGQGKLFRISPATELTLGRMSTNLYNNARHVAPVEDSTGVKKYVATYARDGKVVVSYPTEVSEGAVHRKAATPVDSVIDGTGDRINPAIGYNPNTGKIGLIYASVSSGATVDTNFIWYRHSSIGTPYLFSPATILDTVLVLRAADPTFLTTPAITPCFESGYDFWLSWRAELNKGGVLGLVNSSDVLQANKAFFATGNKQPKFISVTSHKSLAGVRLAWEEYGTSQIQIYYTTGTVSSNVITVAGITDISSLLGVCEAHHPQIATDENGEDQVVWEAFSAISQKVKNTFSTKFSNATYHRTRNHNTGKWSDCDQFFPVSNSLSTSSTAPTNYTFYPNIAYTNAVLLSSVGGGWLDFERITWNNKDSAHSEIVHLGLGTWKGAIMQDGSLEPAMAQCVQTYQIPDAMLFRDPVHQIDSNYDAKMTRSVFPLTPVREVTSTNLVWKQIQINPRSQCAIIKTGDGGGIIAPPGGGKRVINLQPRLEIASDTSQMPPSSASTWGDLSARTKGFVIHAYDTLKYWRYFQLGDDYQPSDTTAYKNAFSDTNDYIKSRVNLRKISDSSLVRVLDTVMMKRNSIVTSGMITTTGGSYVAPYGFTGDSLFMSVEVTRGNANDSWDISYTDVFADTTSTGSMQAFKVAREWNPTPSNTQVSPIVSVVPNPFRQTAMVNIITTTGFPLNVALFDELGRKVTELTNVVADHSEYQFILGTEPLATGMYYLRVQSGSAVVTQQVELLK